MHAGARGWGDGTEDVQGVEEYDMDWGNKPLSLHSSFPRRCYVKESCMYREQCQLCRIITHKENSTRPLTLLFMEGNLSYVDPN